MLPPSKIARDSIEFWKNYNLLNDCSSLEEVINAQKKMEVSLSLRIQPFRKVQVVELDLPLEEEPSAATNNSTEVPEPQPPLVHNDLDMAFEDFPEFGEQSETTEFGGGGATGVTPEFGAGVDAFTSISSQEPDEMAGIVSGDGVDPYQFFTNAS